MTVVEDTEVEAPKKPSKLPMIIGLVLAIAGGGGGFFAVQSGLLGGAEENAPVAEQEEPLKPLADVSFVALPPMVISIGSQPGLQHLRFQAQLESPTEHAEDVEKIVPRIVDVLNGYLRAVEVSELADRRTMPKLRGQMLRRIQIVTGKGRVRDLLIMELVVN